MARQKAANLLLAGMLVFAACPSALSADAQGVRPNDSKIGYDVPPKSILDVMLAPSPPTPQVSPTKDSILLVSLQDYPPMARVAAPFLKLAGVRIEPKNHSKHDSPGGYGITPCASEYTLVRTDGGAKIKIALPENGCPGIPQWSADGKHFAFTNTAEDCVELWIADAKTGATHKVDGVKLNPMFGNELNWMAEQKRLLVKLVPSNLGAPPAEPTTPAGPSIQESSGAKGQSSTYETRDTLTNRHDEDVFDYYAQSQLALVDVDQNTVSPVGKADRYDDIDIAPDGAHVLVTSIHKPYSYITTYDRFPHDVEVWDVSRPAQVASKTIASLPLADRVPIHGVATGPREHSWRANEPATLVWAEALDGGDWNVSVPHRDKVMLSKAPFDAPPVEIAQTEQRYSGFEWGEKTDVALMTEYDHNKHWRKTFIVNIDDRSVKPRLLWDLSTDEKYKNPGGPVHRVLPSGAVVMREEGDAIFLSGNGASTDGDRPFLDRLDLKTLTSQRMFRCDKSSYERFLSFLNDDSSKFLIWHQSPMDPPNAYILSLGKPVEATAGEAVFASSSVALTHIPDPTPEVRAIKKRLVKYKRADGLDLSFTLYTPPNYKEGTRVPTILYAYPLDYAEAATAGQVSGSQMVFTRLRNYKLLLLAGYAIIDNAAFPIVGDPKNAYDTYLDQLTNDAKAAVNEAVKLGVADPNRIGVTGHSHGALMTANLVTHTNLFRAGIATSGAYNKTLTAFGFQSERRSVWEAPDVYQKVSPFFSANKLKTPLLIIHGEEDANPGTTPLQARLLYEAVRGNGGTVRLVMLPHEPHWYTALESNEQLVYEMLSWFDKYVKNAPAK
jgi:dipeptidyl aminopeptidase/acylaminoacyl peptidase